ncbi:hypothetical protein FISHEDRAFT_37829 [Fistulina hepatica ATCC 64428]|nr:hypothetical protein FISHEDRAFT_37829 [Fistulina hepatica ATCC 64428]
MVDKLSRTSTHGSLLFEPEIVERISRPSSFLFAVHLTMSPDPTTLFSLARNKLHLSVGGKDNCSLHRWVLLKNSISRPDPPTPSPASVAEQPFTEDIDDYEDEALAEEADSFMFPDAGRFNDSHASADGGTEAAWLDSLLEELQDDGDEADIDSVLVADDDDDDALSPLVTPNSSSDDLSRQPAYYPPPMTDPFAYPYLVPYPPFHPPLIRPDQYDTLDEDRYEDPLPYHDLDVEELSVPDAIEDTSDDESDTTLTTPSGSVDVDPALIPLPGERSSLRQFVHVYGDTDPYFHSYDIDPLPFSDTHSSSYRDHSPYNSLYQEC